MKTRGLQQKASNPLLTGNFLLQRMEKFSKYNFSGINVKKKVALRFRKFSKEISKSNTETLEAMLNFFQWNDLTPDDDLGVKNNRTNKRINAVIAILKSIEKYQTKPTTVMLQSLFEHTTKLESEEAALIDFGTPVLITENEELDYYRKAFDGHQEKLSALEHELETILKKTSYVKGSFGKGYYKLEFTQEEFKAIKQKIYHVHHNHNPETGR